MKNLLRRSLGPFLHHGVLPAFAVLLIGLLWLHVGPPVVEALLLGVALIAIPAWFAAPVARVVGGAFVAGLLFVFLRLPLGFAPGLLVALATGGLAWRFLAPPVLKRICFLVPSMIFLIYLTTLLMYSAPGSPFAQEKQTTQAVLDAKRKEWGVPKDATAFFEIYMKRVVVDNSLGPSLTVQGRSVTELLGPAFPVSMSLGLTALIFATALGLVLGIRAGLKPNSWADYSSMAVAVAGISLPNFVIGAVLLVIFALKLGWLPVAGWGGFRQLILPAVTLGLPYAAYIARLARAGTIEVMQQDFITTARAKGLSEREVVWKHALKGAILPVVSFLGPAAAGIMTGSFVVETLFGIPGMGPWFVKSAINLDYSMVLGTALVYFGIVIAFNLLVDLAYAWIDPRVREGT